MEIMVRFNAFSIVLYLIVVTVVLGALVLNSLEGLVHGDLTQLDDL